MNRRRWICSDVWMDILPSFDHAQLGLKMALLSDRFDILVDAHFDGKTELTLWRVIRIRKHCEMPKLFVEGKSERLPLPDHPLPNKIRFKQLRIEYINHSVIEFLHANKQIWDRRGTNLELNVYGHNGVVWLIWDVFVPEIWPIFAPNICHLGILNDDHLDKLRRLISPTILTDLNQLNSIRSRFLLPNGIADDRPWPYATAGKALSKWLHTPRKDGQLAARLFCLGFYYRQSHDEWINNFKETFRRATASSSSANYKIRFKVCMPTTPIVPFELVNERTNEKLTLMKVPRYNDEWLLKRCPISGETAATDQWENDENSDANLNNVQFNLWGVDH